ncbi:MAG: hypothetical protein H6581_23380 [Bacteroidia bacterium]|nr:hypothetical protein [Bacteroidia bacterium]
MKKTSISKGINPKSLSAAAREQLTSQLYAVHAQIFDGVDKESFRAYVIEPATVYSRIFLVKNRREETVGYATFQVYQTEIERNGKLRKPYVFRTEMGVIQEFRGGAPINQALLLEALKFSLLHGIPEAYYMATPINPVAYYLTCRDTAIIYPQPGIETPAHIVAIKDQLSLALNLPQASETNRFVKKVGWIVRMSEAQLLRMQSKDNPWFQYYLQENPDFSRGNGLMWLAPANLKNGVLCLGKMLARKCETQLQKITFSLPRQLRRQLSFLY